MIHAELTAFEKVCARILPVPKQVEQLGGEGLQLKPGTKVRLSAPKAEFGPVKTAGEKISALFAEHCGGLCSDADALPVNLSLGKAEREIKNEAEGYSLKISADGIDIVGFGERGLLYGVVTLLQLCCWDNEGCWLPAMKVVDWPENPIRGINIESRYGSNVMDRQGWLDMLEDAAAKKLNFVNIQLYGCWQVQYDGRVAEYLYMPVKGHPELKTPMVVKYYSPKEGRWIDYEKLPPLFCNDLLDEVFRVGRDLGLSVFPTWNSFGHNTLIPAKIPEVSSKNANGEPELTGLCTSNPATYDLLFSIYDQIIDDYMIPYGMDIFCLGLDEVHEGPAMNADDLFRVRSPWCSCPQCRDIDKGDIFIRHAVKLVSYLKSRGMKTVIMDCDMLLTTRRQSLGWLGDRLMHAMDEAGLRDTLLIDWWAYFDIVEKAYFDNIHPELGLRSVTCPWNGYYNWCLLTNPMRCVELNGKMNYRDGGEGMYIYATWDKSYDRIHDALADYAWDYKGAGTVSDVTDRHVLRHFAARAEQARHAFALMDWCTEERVEVHDQPLKRVISNFNMLLYTLSFYTYSYARANKPYPRNFPGEALEVLLGMRMDYERALYSISSMAREAAGIWQSIALDPRCNMELADRMAYECENYLCLVEDWIALLKMYDLTRSGQHKAVAPVARARRQARLELMAHCERTKEKFIAEALTMRNHSVFMQLFDDIARYIESNENPVLDLMDLTDVISERSLVLR